MGSLGMRCGSLAVLGALATSCASPPVGPTAAGGTRPAAGPAPAEASAPAEDRVLAVGGFLDIALPSNASTGHGWELVETGAPVLRQTTPPPSVDDHPATAPVPGAGGTARWRFVAEQAGTAEVRLVYRRAWEKDVPPAREARYRVTVSAPSAPGGKD
ncbi:protease inhibitor I42 family protein [Pseudoxanthomonas beigongshangi]